MQELSQVRKALDLERVHILGHSWGTMLAMDYFLTEPEGVVSLVMASPCISIPHWLEDCAQYRRQLPTEVQEVLDRHERAGTTDSEEYKEATEEFTRRHVRKMDPLPEVLARA